MARERDTRGIHPAQVPTYGIDPNEVDAAYEAYAALQRASADSPGLLDNKYWLALQDTAFARFYLNFKAL